MRFDSSTSVKYPEYKDKKFFALFPVSIGSETRWLEIVNVQYKRVKIYPRGSNYFLDYYYEYKKTNFIGD